MPKEVITAVEQMDGINKDELKEMWGQVTQFERYLPDDDSLDIDKSEEQRQQQQQQQDQNKYTVDDVTVALQLANAV